LEATLVKNSPPSPSQCKKPGHGSTPIIPAATGSLKQEARHLGRPRQYEDPISKFTRTKMAGGVALVVECLPNKCEVLNSNSSTANKNRKEKI
jgi:hypothetical protein